MPLRHQKWLKWESETNIINALFEGDKRFGELLEMTELSKPVLIRRLKELKKKGKVEFIPEEETRRFHYHLLLEGLNIDDMIQTGIDLLSKDIVDGLKGAALKQEIHDMEYNELLKDSIPLLFQFRMWAWISASKDIQRELLKVSLGIEFAKNIKQIFPKNRKIFPKFIPLWQVAGNYPPDSKEFKEHLLEQIYSTIKHLTEFIQKRVLNESKSE